MSGGSLNYFYSELEDHEKDLGDKELNQLVHDLAQLFHDREWYLSSDTCEGDWNESRDKFKEKWFTEHGRQERIEQYLAEFADEIWAYALYPVKAQKPDESKYEYHTDHTDCPWFITGEESKCPVTCCQYRDGWNDAMNYIFRNGDGYRPYDRIRKGR